MDCPKDSSDANAGRAGQGDEPAACGDAFRACTLTVTAPILGSFAVRLREEMMAKLDTAERKAIPSREFGLPGKRKYPMPDKSHAANAKARATQEVKRGKLSAASAAKIRAKADSLLKGN